MCICNNCAYTVFFNAKIMGLIEEKEEEDIDDSKKLEQKKWISNLMDLIFLMTEEELLKLPLRDEI